MTKEVDIITSTHQTVTIDHATSVITEQQLADQAAEELFDNEDNAQKTSGVIANFVESYSQHKNTQPLEQWLALIKSSVSYRP